MLIMPSLTWSFSLENKTPGWLYAGWKTSPALVVTSTITERHQSPKRIPPEEKLLFQDSYVMSLTWSLGACRVTRRVTRRALSRVLRLSTKLTGNALLSKKHHYYYHHFYCELRDVRTWNTLTNIKVQTVLLLTYYIGSENRPITWRPGTGQSLKWL